MERRELASTIAGTQKLHSFKPVNSYSLEVRSFSASTETCIKKVAQNMQCIQNQDINGYVAVTYDKEWYVGYVMEKDNEKKEAKITFMQPKGPARSFTYPSREDILVVAYTDILRAVNVETVSGRVYKVNKSEQDDATRLNKSKI